jgi:flagellar hook-associated protein 3 FlgL
MTTLSTLGQNRLIRTEMSKVQLDINRLQQQISSGKKTDQYGDLGALAPLDISLRNKGEQITNFKANIQTLKARTDIIDNTLTSVRSEVLDMRNIALANKMFDTGRADITSRATSAVKDIMQKLQTNVDGRFLFGGVTTDTPPMADSTALLSAAQTAVNAALVAPVPDVVTAVRNAVSGVLATTSNYYVGGAKHGAPEIDEGVTADYSITGDDPAFSNTLQSLLMLATLPPPQDDPVTRQPSIVPTGTRSRTTPARTSRRRSPASTTCSSRTGARSNSSIRPSRITTRRSPSSRRRSTISSRSTSSTPRRA